MNDKISMWYKIQVTLLNEEQEPYTFKVQTKDIERTMEQYQRNREPFHWKILEWNVRV
jgi:hypothetical protein